MDARVKEQLDRVRGTAANLSGAAGATARCAGQLLDVAKLNIRIFDLNAEVSGLLREIGQMVYDTHAGSDPDTAAMDGLLARIDAKTGEIAALRARVNALRSSRACPRCGVACGREDRFCRQCGGALEPDAGDPAGEKGL